MLTLYLACLISGGILLIISMFSGGDADGDMDHGLDAHSDFDHSLDAHAGFDHSLDAHADISHGLDAHGEIASSDAGGGLDHGVDSHIPATVVGHGDVSHSGDGGALAAAFQFFSFRNIVYLTTFFGLTGSLLTWLGTAAGVTLIAAAGMGAFAMTVGHKFMSYLKASESGQGFHERDFVGHVGTIALATTKEQKGKVRLSTGGQVIELLAQVHPDSEREAFRYGEHVLILDIEKNIALIDEADFAEDTA